MDLPEFSRPLPKPWLNINANSVVSFSSASGTVLEIGSCQVNTSGTITLQPSDIVNGALGALPPAATVNLPTGTALTNYFLAQAPLVYAQAPLYFFRFNVYNGASGTLTLNPGAGCLIFNNPTGWTIPTGGSSSAIFAQTSPNQWTIFR